MSTTGRNFTLAQVLFVLLFAAALFVRLVDLGAAPLSETEAVLALQAYSTLPGHGPADLGSDPGYAALTGFLFFLAGDTEFSARLLPALAGAALALLPLFLWRRLGLFPALLLGAALAFDPVLVGVSRLASGPMPAIGFLSLAVVLRIAKQGDEAYGARMVAAGVFAALGILSGPPAFLGILILALTWGITRVLGIPILEAAQAGGEGREESGSRRAGWIAFGLTLLLAGTLFLRFPQGIGSFAASLPEFLSGWLHPTPVPKSRVLIALGAYHGIPLAFAVLFAWRSWRDDSAIGKRLSIWFVVAAALVLLYAGRQVADLSWLLLPLWAMAAGELGRAALWSYPVPRRPLMLAAAIVVLLLSFRTNLASLSYTLPDDPQYILRVAIMAGTLLLAALSISLVAMGWDTVAARAGTVWGIGILMAFSMLSGIWGTSHRDPSARRELWLPAPMSGQERLLDETLRALGSWTQGDPESIDISVRTESAALLWALRNYYSVRLGAGGAADALPSVVIADGDEGDLRLASAYRGQGFVWNVYPAWEQMASRDWLHWLLFREAPSDSDEMIVWARADLFLAGAELAGDASPLDSLEEDAPEEVIPLEDVEDFLPGK